MNKRLLIVEDDKIQADELRHRIEHLGWAVDHISTELEFRRRVRQTDITLYSLAVVDMMLRWTDPAPEMEQPPPEVIQEGFYTAGLRCCRQLSARGVRCVIYPALDPEKIRQRPNENFMIINKSNGSARLMEEITRLDP
jgi:ActR/RegA family two-component response regulator